MASRVALDVMGGDHAPSVVLDGVQALLAPGSGFDPDRLLLVGDREVIESGLGERGLPDLAILASEGVVGMGEKPAVALRAKPKASIPMMMGAVREGAAGAAVSMGNTGAMVGAATMLLRTLPGVRRPAIAVTTAFTGRPVTIADMGANVEPRASDLLEYAVMATAYQRDVLGVPNPRVGLLNIGEEEEKGTALAKEARSLLDAGSCNFVGNVEPGDLFTDTVDVLVTDGFTGNILLKMIEAFGDFLIPKVVQAAASHGAEIPRQALSELSQQLSYSDYGGALLMGVRGIVLIGHGRSDARAVQSAVQAAASALDKGINDTITRALEV